MNAIDALTQSNNGRWVARFRLRGREYTMVAGGTSTLGDGWARFRVFNSTGKQVDVKVRENDNVEILSWMGHWDYAEVPA